MEKLIINNIKTLALDMIDKAGSGHPGIVLSAAPILYTLYAKHLNVNVNNPDWINRDRFIMSAGHGSALLYATLYMAGFDISLDDLKNFRRAGFKTPGHPEYGMTKGVDMSTGPLGQGIASAVGMAIASKKLNQEFMFPKKSKLSRERSLIDYYVYVLCGDGDLMEGVSYEALSLAGTLKLNNLIILYDSNDMSLDGKTEGVFTENTISRFESMGFNVEVVKDGTSVSSIDKAISKAESSDKPTLIQVKTILGKDSLKENTNTVHGTPLDKEDILAIKNKYGINSDEFYVSEEARNSFSKTVFERTKYRYDEWLDNYNEFVRDNNKEKLNILNNPNYQVDLSHLTFESDLKEATRVTNGKVMNEIKKLVPNLIGGSADLASSTKTELSEYNYINSDDFSGFNIKFGVREHAMGSILNGLALSNYRPFGSTFLVFSDYLKPAIRMSALMNLPVTYIFTHDSINIGADGPTHQPIEQLASLRSIPNLQVFRPSDAHELVGSWEYIINSKKPSALVLSRHEVNLLRDTNAKEVSKGGYVVIDSSNLHGILIATGSDLQTACNIANNLKPKGINLRVVSMPSRELFLKQDINYRQSILPKGYRTIVIESGSKMGWEGFVYDDKYLITVNEFGLSGTKDEVLEKMNFSYDQILERVLKLLK